MIDIRTLSGESFDTSPDTYMVFELVSDLFNTGDSFEVNKTYPVDLPLTRKNKRLIGNKHLIENRGREKKRIEVFVYLNEKPFKKGALKYEIGSDTIKGVLKMDSGEAEGFIKNTTLNEAMRTVGAKKEFYFTPQQLKDHMMATAIGGITEHDYVFFPYKNIGFLDAGLYLVFLPLGGNQAQPGAVYSVNGHEYEIIRAPIVAEGSGFIYAAFKSDTVIPPESGTLTRVSGSGDPSYNYSRFWLTTPEKIITNRNFHVNAWGDTGSGKGFLSRNASDSVFLITPFLRVVPVIKLICRYLGFEPTGTFLENEEFNRLVIYNTSYLMHLNTTSSSAVPVTFDYQYLVPQIPLADFFGGLKRMFGLSFFFDSITGNVVINDFRSIAGNQDYTDLTSFAVPGYSISEETGKGFSIKVGADPNDKIYEADEDAEFVFGDGEEDWDTKAGTLKEIACNNENDGLVNWLVPAAVQMRSEIKETAQGMKLNPPFSFRMLYYRGMQDDGAGNPYPLASPGYRNYAGEVIGINSMLPEDAKNFYSVFLKPYFEFFSGSEKVPMRFLLPYQVLDQLDFADKLAVKIRNEVLIKYLPGRIQFELPARGGKVLTEIDMYPLLKKDFRAWGSNDFAVDGPLYYVELKQENFRHEQTQDPEGYRQLADYRAYFYSDDLATQPVDPVSLNVQISEKIEDLLYGFTYSITHTVACNGTSFLALTDKIVRIQEYDPVTFDLTRDEQHTYTLLPGVSYREV